jgi:hypothetical protein
MMGANLAALPARTIPFVVFITVPRKFQPYFLSIIGREHEEEQFITFTRSGQLEVRCQICRCQEFLARSCSCQGGYKVLRSEFILTLMLGRRLGLMVLTKYSGPNSF